MAVSRIGNGRSSATIRRCAGVEVCEVGAVVCSWSRSGGGIFQAPGTKARNMRQIKAVRSTPPDTGSILGLPDHIKRDKQRRVLMLLKKSKVSNAMLCEPTHTSSQTFPLYSKISEILNFFSLKNATSGGSRKLAQNICLFGATSRTLWMCSSNFWFPDPPTVSSMLTG